jgi:hypothetical protein
VSGGGGARCADDLLALGRRRALSVEERCALDAHLGACELCRIAAAVGDAVGPLPAVDDDDRRMAERLVARALAPRALAPQTIAAPAAGAPAARAARVWRRASAGRRERRGARHAAASVAATLLLAGIASAAWWKHDWAPPTRPAHLAAGIGSGAAPHIGRRRSDGEPTAEQVVPAPDPAPNPLPAERGEGFGSPPPAPPAPRRAQAHAPAAAPAATPAALLRDANEARRARQLAEAERRYRDLQVAFPASAEAKLSHLSLGDLRLGAGAPAEALAEFDAYLGSDDAALVEEAMVGKARALARLGRAADERALWQALLARFPSSDYRWRAQQRLDELSQEAP